MLLAAAQVHSASLDIAGNLATVERLAYEAARAGVRLVVFPELFLTGATFAAGLWRLAPTPDDAIERRVAALAQATGLHIVVGTAERRDENLYNTALLAAPGRPLERYTKMHLFAADAFSFRPGVGAHVWDTALGRVGVGICYDMLYPTPWQDYAGAVDLVVIPSAWPDFDGSTTRLFGLGVPTPTTPAVRAGRVWIDDLPRRISESVGAPVVYSNHVGWYDVVMVVDQLVAHCLFPPTSAVHDGDRMIGLADGEGLAIGQVPLATRRAAGPAYTGVQEERHTLDMRLTLLVLAGAEAVGVRAGYHLNRAVRARQAPEETRLHPAPRPLGLAPEATAGETAFQEQV
jgi:predicted amidohydrolase